MPSNHGQVNGWVGGQAGRQAGGQAKKHVNYHNECLKRVPVVEQQKSYIGINENFVPPCTCRRFT